ncbi:MAG: hypothetical protein GY757_37515 [bacterium]|nr:hypothetical protein [bacterium]
MNRNLKAVNIEKCFSLLREFISESQDLDHKKGVAGLALNHLQRITAGTVPADPTVNLSGLSCVDTPRLDGIPYSTG